MARSTSSPRRRPDEARERVEREDMVMFINACFACTRQQEFYSDKHDQSVSIEFLHAYIHGNYRRLYARTLAAGINHFNQGQVIANLLALGSPADPLQRREEGRLIAAALARLPPNRVFNIFRELRYRRTNNRRTRAVIGRYLRAGDSQGAERLVFHAVKYRNKMAAAAAHAHLKLQGELHDFLFDFSKVRNFETPLFEQFRKAHYDKGAIYEMPFTVAEGLAARHGISRRTLLDRIEGRMTTAERLRLQQTADRTRGVEIDVDLHRIGLTRLAVYVLSLPYEVRRERRDELKGAFQASARRALKRAPMRLRRVAAVLDRSYSSSGSTEKKRRPLAVALAASYLLEAAAGEYRAFWSVPVDDDLLVSPRGQSNLADPLLDAVEWGLGDHGPTMVIIVSDGFENDPPGGVDGVARQLRRVDPEGRIDVVHMNPVFDAERYTPKTLGAAVPTVGLRDAEDVPTMLGFARFASGTAPLAELESYLAAKMGQLLDGDSP